MFTVVPQVLKAGNMAEFKQMMQVRTQLPMVV
jgi:hypothetical protein